MNKKLLFFIAALGAVSLLFAAERDQDNNSDENAGKQSAVGAPGKNRGQEKKAAREAEPAKEAAPARKAGAPGRAVAPARTVVPAGTVPPARTWTRPARNVPAEGRPARAVRPAA